MTRALKTPPRGPHVQVTTSTWAKDSHGLYDYEAQEDAYRKETYFLKSNCKIYRDMNAHQTFYDCVGKINQANATYSFVAEIAIDKSKGNPQFKLKSPPKKEIIPNQQENNMMRVPYIVVRDYSKNGVAPGYPLKPGNVIKFGRVEYMVIESKNEEETFTLRDTNHFEETNGIFQISKHKIERQKGTQQLNCKVCLCSEETIEDPLISPCNCKGSCQLIHVGCLKTWINSKVKKQIKGIASSYNFTKFECQICKFPFPKVVKFQHKDVEMMTITKPNKPYILLESLCNKFQNKQERCLHLISTEENSPIKIGRGHECEIRITDISVSRKHAEIILKEGQFYIVDTKAKFGTLVKLEEDFVLTGRPIKIQFGRTVFQFKAKSQQVEEVDTE